ncbi:MAG: hypothetical protein L6365_14150 [Desulfobulbaceae bacterium]|nr:hypothetical protein [Desulfobulbaceae bacterium]
MLVKVAGCDLPVKFAIVVINYSLQFHSSGDFLKTSSIKPMLFPVLASAENIKVMLPAIFRKTGWHCFDSHHWGSLFFGC